MLLVDLVHQQKLPFINGITESHFAKCCQVPEPCRFTQFSFMLINIPEYLWQNVDMFIFCCRSRSTSRASLPAPQAAPTLPAECLQQWWLWRACLCGSSAACPEPRPATPFPLDRKRPRPLRRCVWTATPAAPDRRWRTRTFWSCSSWCRHCLQTPVTDITLVQVWCCRFEDSTPAIPGKRPGISGS